jgi:mono/diheme cytochrome c family protein
MIVMIQRFLPRRPRRGLRHLAVAFAALFALHPATAQEPAAEQLEYFETHVRPVLAENCVECHGPPRQRSGLRLDSRAGVLRGGESGPALVPGDVAQSLLLQVLRYDGAVKMPPPGKLDDAAIAAIEHWVAMGAPWPAETAEPLDAAKPFAEIIAEAREQHWAFQPVTAPALPEVSDGAWARSPIDYFVLAQLEQAGLGPSPTAGKRTLIRRATFDLIGLPPTRDEVEAFEQDDSPEAFETVVDRLLASPHYGERWARYWLDVARYADTKGYVFQEERAFPFSHTYRDYVIRAFNDDLPYDEFLMHQLAADQMELGEDKRPLAAMGYLTLGRRFIGNVHDIVDDRIDVVTRGMMGLTVSCARCHDHKYDPISAADYYALYGVFRSSEEPAELPLIAAPNMDDTLYQEYVTEVTAKETEVARFLERLHVELLQHTRDITVEYLMAAHEARDVQGDEPLQTIARDRALRWQLVQRWRAFLNAKTDAPDAVWTPWQAFAALAPDEFAARAPELAQRFVEAKHEAQPVNARIAAAFKGDAPASMDDVAARYGRVLHSAAREWADLLASHSQIAARTGAFAPPAGLPDPDADAIRLVLYGADSPANIPAADVEMLSDVPTQNKVRDRRNAVLRVQATHPGRPDRAMALVDAAKLFDPYVFLRGKVENKGEKVPRRFLEVLDPAGKAFEQGSGRLELAQAIASAENPLTARVMVNRVWMYHFGQALVDSTSDFGLRSDEPTHPELLDYLAARFVQEGWSMKKLHRAIMLSNAYQQASEDREDGLSMDPENRLLWRQNRQRLDLESMRDAVLAAAGTLDATMFGPSVTITQRPFPTRRSVYSFIERQNLPGMFRTFDFASPDTHSPKRYATTVPQQALFMMNGPFVVEQARLLAGRAVGEPVERVRELYARVFQRYPTEEELRLAEMFLEQSTTSMPIAPPGPREWQYGYGTVDEAANAVVSFTPMPHWTGQAWQGGPNLPDAALGWVTLHSHGGHPGGDADHSVIRRWISPVEGVIGIVGDLKHGAEAGDGVIGYIVSSRDGIVWKGAVRNGEIPTNVEIINVAPGDTLDLVVACGENEQHDSFTWHPRIYVNEAVGDIPVKTEWLARLDFAGPPPQPPAPLEPWEQYAQVLLMTNEFMFVD